MPARRPVTAGLAALLALVVAPSEAIAGGRHRDPDAPAIKVARAVASGPMDRVSSAGRQLLARGYLVRQPGLYDRGKAALQAAHVPGSRGASVVSPTPPLTLRRFNGTFDPRTTPPDPTGALGPTRYVQLVNTRFAIFRRGGHRLSEGDLGVFTGMGRNFAFLTDPQIIWDAGSRRFYYVVLDFDIAVRNRSDRIDYAFGFSKTGSPRNARDWCKYTVSLGYDDPRFGRRRVGDQPHLGDSADYVLWGVNVFDVSGGPRFIGADVDWVSKPARGRRCPRPGRLLLGARHDIRTAGGARAFTPVVADQIDRRHTGWVVAAQRLGRPSSKGRALSVFRVTRSRAGAVIQGRGRAVAVPAYSFPPPAPQAGSSHPLDTLDGRLTQAVGAVDPSRDRMAVWTQHAVRGGAGSEVRWYEIDPARRRVLRRGQATDPNLFVFNGAVSSDRAVRRGFRRFGRSMVLGFNTASGSTDAAVQMVSKVGDGPQSGFVLVRRSRGPAVDFSCADTCRWGDYAGASPDPLFAAKARRGRVWLTNMWNRPNRRGVDWRTVIWQSRP